MFSQSYASSPLSNLSSALSDPSIKHNTEKNRASQPSTQEGLGSIGINRTSTDVPISSGRSDPSSLSSGQGDVPTWLKDDSESRKPQEVFSSPYSGGADWNRTQNVPVEDLNRRPFFIREVPRAASEPEYQPERKVAPLRSQAFADAHMAPPPSKVNDITPIASQSWQKQPEQQPEKQQQEFQQQPEKLQQQQQQQFQLPEKKQEQQQSTMSGDNIEECPMPLPNLQDLISKYVPPKAQYVIYYRDPVYSVLVLGAVAGLLHLLTRNSGFGLFWFISFVMKWALLGAIALNAGSYIYNKYVNKNPRPQNYVATRFRPTIDRWLGRIVPMIPPQDTVRDKLGVVLNGVYRAPRRYLDTLYSSNWTSMFRGLVALQVIQTILSWFSPRGLMWTLFALVCTVPKIYQMYRRPIDRLIDMIHGKLVAIFNAISQYKNKLNGPSTSSMSSVPKVPLGSLSTVPQSDAPVKTSVSVVESPTGGPPKTIITTTIISPEDKKIQ